MFVIRQSHEDLFSIIYLGTLNSAIFCSLKSEIVMIVIVLIEFDYMLIDVFIWNEPTYINVPRLLV